MNTRNYVLLVLINLMVIGCSSSEESSTAITLETNTPPKVEKKNVVYTMEGHPLAKYSEAEDFKIMQYFPILESYCGPRYPASRCDVGISESIRVSNEIGFKIKESDFRNPKWWQFQLKVLNKKRDKLRSYSARVKGLTFSQAQPIYEEEKIFIAEARRRLSDFKKGSY